MNRAALALLLLLVACSARSQLLAADHHEPAGTGGTGGSTTGTGIGTGGATTQPPPVDAGPDAPVTPPPDAAPDIFAAKLAGHWMRWDVGNCIDVQEWLTFEPPTGFVHTFVDHNACGPHFVASTPGSFSAEGQIVQIDWGGEHRIFSAAVLDAYPGGGRGLNTKAYRRAGAPLVWHREDVRTSVWSGEAHTSSLIVDVALDAGLAPSAAPVACTMTLTITASVSPSSDPKPAVGTETFTLPCTYGPTATSPWMRLAADGFELYDGSWHDVLKAHGIYGKYASGVAVLFERCRPSVYFDPADTSVWWHDVSDAWFFESKMPPPDKVD